MSAPKKLFTPFTDLQNKKANFTMQSYEKKESFEQKRKRLASVKVWVENFMDADQKNKNILESFEKNAELELNTDATRKIDPNAEPINILVIGEFE